MGGPDIMEKPSAQSAQAPVAHMGVCSLSACGLCAGNMEISAETWAALGTLFFLKRAGRC